ncbi:hypothetical protein SAMN05444287_1351 [Octadecabacter temperatus]|uniref:Uncharacterized protein n=1 Tax=Octadecabacter temperatus TaxID=1458307 RepID=A0A0K0Y5Y6_9RHOB|nr:hypothetical protein [Octadecabacter temperatus]AKS46242.1 hypothetical protein OSB_16940 [Octadecabacter temperatus]SIO10374.1 hypothetical protein SAMN05444287_1351 [Octadecabacter temperatus]
MTLMNTLRDRLTKRAAFKRTQFELANLPVEFAINDLGICPADAKKIAAKAVYG